MKDTSEQSAKDRLFTKPLEIVRPTFPQMNDVFVEFSRCLAAGQVTNNGRWVQEFERQLTAYLGVPAIVFSSGQAALMTMIRAAGVTSGEVVVPSLTFAATAHAAVWAGAQVVFADIKDDLSFSIDPADVERRITSRTTAILAVDPYGIACDYDALAALARRHGLRLLYDSAPSFGTLVHGKPVGGYGDAQIFSFHATKAFNTMEGGCLASHDAELIERAKVIRNFGQVAGGDCTLPGLNGKMMEICALIGLKQLERFDVDASNRRRCAERISHGLSAIPGIGVGHAPAGQEPIWLYLPVVVEASVFGCDRDAAAAALAGHGLNVRKYYSPPCHTMSVYAIGKSQPPLPVSERLAASVLALPVYNDMTTAECDGIVEAFRRVADEAIGAIA